MQKLQLNLAVRLYPPSVLNKNKWNVENFDTTKIFSVPQVAVVMLLYCAYVRDRNEIIGTFSEFYKYSHQEIDKFINSLIEMDLLVDILNNEEISEVRNSKIFLENYPIWKSHNWEEAAKYHFFTYDYKFLDYSASGQGWSIANTRMNDYSAKRPDTNRIKSYPSTYDRIKLPWSINENNSEIGHVQEKMLNRMTFKQLSIVTSTAFSKTNEAPIRWEGAPLIRRTSPSGGSRHPTEGYVFVLDIDGLDPGIYHAQSDSNALTKIKAELPEKLHECFPSLFHLSTYIPSVIIVMTSVFERNMFRYRDPRTFRTIHMDVGHILGTIELVTSQLGIKSKISNQFNEAYVESLIEVNGLIEGAMSSIALY